MNQTYLKILSLLLACAFLLGMLPAAFAAEILEETANTEPEVSTAPTEETTTPEEKEMEAGSFAPLETSPEPPDGEPQPTENVSTNWEAAEDAISPQASVTGTVTRSDDINGKYYFWGDAVRTYQFTYADGTAVTAKVGGMCIHYVDGVVAYCIEPGTGSSHNVAYTGTPGEESAFWLKKLTQQQRNAISLILLYGAPNYTKSTDKDTEFGYEGATQVLIWEIVMGLRSSTPPYSRNDRRLYDTFAGGDFPSFDTGYAQIVRLMQAHLTIPSFSSTSQTGAPEITLKYDAGSNLYKTSVTDTNGVLASDYSFTASGVTMSKSGNTLNISAPLSALANGSVLASATGRSLDPSNMAYMIWTASGKQTVATVEASAEPVKAYFKIKADAIPGTATVRKTTDSGDVEGYCFKIYRWDSNTSWYGKTDGDGNLYLTDSAYSQSGTKTYAFSNLLDGEYTFLEVLSQKGAGLVFPDSWNITVTDKAGKTVYDQTFTAADFTTDDNGDCRLNKISVTGLTGGGNMTMTIHNVPVTGSLEILKTSDDGKISGITFTLEEWVSGIGYCRIGTYTTDSSGKISIPNLKVGTQYRVTETVPEGYEAEAQSQEITLQAGTNTLTFVNHRLLALEILKTSDDGKVSGISFTVERLVSGSGYQELGTYITDGNGRISIPGLSVGTTLRVTETVPQNYTAEKQTQVITIQEGTNTLTFVNHYMLEDLEILKISPDGKVDGITFTVTDSRGNVAGSGVTDRDGRLVVPGLTKGVAYTVEETVPEGYVCDNSRQTVIIRAGTNTVTFENRPIYGNLELTKIDASNPEIKLSGAEFTVTREIPSEDPSLGSAIREQVMPEVLDADGHGTGVYRLEHLRYGHYTIRETKAPEGYELSNEVFTIDITEDGKTYTVSSSGFDGVPNRQQVGSVQVKKVDPEGNPLAGVSFLLEYSQDGKNWKSVTFREEGSLPEVGSCTSSGLKDGILTTAEDGIAMFSGLSISIGDNHIYYRLTETVVPEGYSLLAKPAFEGELPQNGSRDITVTAVNSSQYMLPFTGNIGFTTVTFGLLLTELALCAAVFLFRKKKQEG